MIDLHVHSIFSDGSLTPEDLVARAAEGGLSAIALTDHDTTAGVPRFLAAGEEHSVRAISGVEISADFKGGTMHMLGYFVDPAHRALNEKLEWIREGRKARNAEVLEKLHKLGFGITWEDVKSYAGDEVVGRPHFAQALQARGCVASKDEAFDRYLGKGKPAYAERRRLTPEDSLQLIIGAGGVPVLAHPFTLNINSQKLRDLVKDLASKGLQGIEVYYSEHTAPMVKHYLGLTKKFGLVATGGSDFHGALTPDIRLGRGFGNLDVPDAVVDALAARRPGVNT